jgi:hypothetical protein
VIWIICLGSSYFLPYAHPAPLVLHSGISGSVALSTAYQPPGWSTVPNALLHFIGRNIGSSRGYLPFPLLFISAVVISWFHFVYISFCLGLVEGNMYMRFMRYEVMRFAWGGLVSFLFLHYGPLEAGQSSSWREFGRDWDIYHWNGHTGIYGPWIQYGWSSY